MQFNIKGYIHSKKALMSTIKLYVLYYNEPSKLNLGMYSISNTFKWSIVND